MTGVRKEADLYPPLKRFLESQGYEVKGEVQGCDVVAVRGEEPPVVVELKLSLNLGVILQAVDRMALSSAVYIGVPADCSALRQRGKAIQKLLRRLGLGLLKIEPTKARVEALLDPGEYLPRESAPRKKRLLAEFARRVGDPNIGGSATRAGRVTAYRQRALSIAQHLEASGPTKASEVAAALGEVRARDILYRDVYGWFERVSKGVYALSPRGKRETPHWRQRLEI